MAENLTPEQRALSVVQAINDAGHYLVRHKHVPDAPSDIIAAAIRSAVEAERGLCAKAAERIALDATAAGNEHAAAGALAVSAAIRSPSKEAANNG